MSGWPPSARALWLWASIASLAPAACRHRADPQADQAPQVNGGTAASERKKGRMTEPKIDRQCDFSQVERTFASYPCTPVLGPEHVNVIRINAPEEVTFVPHGDEPLGEDTRFVICGAIQMLTDTLDQLGIRGDTLDALMLVAVDARNNRTYTGAIARFGTREPMPDDLRKPRTPGYLIGESFNPNLVLSFDLPPAETDYYVHAALGPFKSNVLKVRLRRRK